jgi:hypothetical protein
LTRDGSDRRPPICALPTDVQLTHFLVTDHSSSPIPFLVADQLPRRSVSDHMTRFFFLLCRYVRSVPSSRGCDAPQLHAIGLDPTRGRRTSRDRLGQRPQSAQTGDDLQASSGHPADRGLCPRALSDVRQKPNSRSESLQTRLNQTSPQQYPLVLLRAAGKSS